MKAIFELDLEDGHDSECFRRMSKAEDMASFLWDLTYDPDGVVPTDVQDYVRAQMIERHIVLEEIYT